MPLDAICLSALSQELSSTLVGGRIDKIHQPAHDEVILSLRTSDGGLRLLLSASPTRPRAQLTELSRENPAQPPMFCMLLRKHLSGGRIRTITQPPMERLLSFEFDVTDELGDPVVKTLVLEAMGRHSNLILLDPEGRIVDCLRKVSQDMSSERQILPGMFYRLPPEQGKLNPLSLSDRDKEKLVSQISREKPMDKWLVENFAGVSPLIARELAFETVGETDEPVGEWGQDLLQRLTSLITKVNEGQAVPYLLIRDQKPADFSFRAILQYGPSTELRQMESFSKLLDAFYAERESSERIRQKGQDLIRSVTTIRDRVARKLGFQRKELEDTQDREALRVLGDLITANLYRLEKGMKTFEAENFYDPEGCVVTVKLDPLRSPSQNAARYYKEYQKAKTAEQVLTEQIQKGETELVYLQSVLETLSRAEGERDLEDIRREMEDGGYIRRRSKEKGKIKRSATKPFEFRASSGLRISVGRNNSQNDELTCKLASRSDLWFHVQGIHGAHVILWTEGKDPDLRSMTEAAQLAAWFSQGRAGGKIPVDYTPVKFVKKPNGAKPGMVVYQQYETAYVTPDEDVVKALQMI